MTCRSHGCGPLESCKVEEGERSCRPNSYASCWIRGPGSYHTFDGLTYQYPGACRLTLAKVMGLSGHPHFVVTAEKVPRGQQGFARLLKFEAEGTHVSIEMSSSSRIQVREWNNFETTGSKCDIITILKVRHLNVNEDKCDKMIADK